MPADHGDVPPEENGAFTPPELDLAGAISGLDRATKDFTRRLAEAQGIADRAAALRLPSPDPAGFGQSPAAPAAGEAAPPNSVSARMLEAEHEARLYLERAKQRADSLIAKMIEAVEQETAAVRREAEEGVRARWQRVENEAREHLEEAARVGDGIVAERQGRLAALSDSITERAEILSAGLDDAERVRIQFEAFVRALALTADRIAQQQPAADARTLTDLHGLPLERRAGTVAA